MHMLIVINLDCFSIKTKGPNDRNYLLGRDYIGSFILVLRRLRVRYPRLEV